MQRAYLFEAKGIQRWMMEGGKLRDIAAGSAVLAWAARSDEKDLLAAVLGQAEFEPSISRRAGGAFVLHYGATDEAAFLRFRALWRLAFSRVAPGLEFNEGLGEDGGSEVAAGANAYAPSNRRAAARQNGPASLPPFAHPVSMLARRTGRPAVEADGRFDRAKEGLDAVLTARRRAWDAMKTGNPLTDSPAEILGRGIYETHPELNWPDRMEDDGLTEGVLFPFQDAERKIAVIHADISGLGDFYKHVREQAGNAGNAVDFMRDASTAIEAAVKEAAAKAAATHLRPVNEASEASPKWVAPARPVLIGGDDITLIVRADLAMGFAEDFLKALEDETEAKLGNFCREHGLRDHQTDGIAIALTAACGVAIGGPKQPFFRLLRLAEDLCGAAKRKSKSLPGFEIAKHRPASVIAFHRVTESALAAGADALAERVRIGGLSLTAQPYRVGNAGEGDGLPTLLALATLIDKLEAEDLKVGRLREIRGLWVSGQTGLAEADWVRWRHVAAKRSAGALAELDKALKVASGAKADPATWDGLFRGDLAKGATPLFDALEWRAFS